MTRPAGAPPASPGSADPISIGAALPLASRGALHTLGLPERFEELARAFYDQTGLWPPGHPKAAGSQRDAALAREGEMREALRELRQACADMSTVPFDPISTPSGHYAVKRYERALEDVDALLRSSPPAETTPNAKEERDDG